VQAGPDCGQLVEEPQAVHVIEKDVLTSVAAGHQVIEGSRKLKAKGAGHEAEAYASGRPTAPADTRGSQTAVVTVRQFKI
jgi:hypothetical protein